MGSKVDGSDAPDVVTMNDLKTLETTLVSSMEAKMEEMHQLIMRLSTSTASPPSNSEATAPQSKETGKTNSKENEVVGDDTSKSSSSKKDRGKDGYNEVSHVYSPDPPIPHPHIHNRGDPPKLSASTFSQWQFFMKSHVCSSSIELWKIIENGLHVGNPNNLTRREVVDSQLNATALHMIQLGVGDKDMPHIQHLSTAKEAWDALTELFIGNESMRRNRYDALSNEAEGFYMLDGEDHEDMYRGLKSRLSEIMVPLMLMILGSSSSML